MNITALLALLQAAASVLTIAQGPTATTAFKQQAVNFGSHAVQAVTQAAAPISFSVPENTGIWPNTSELMSAPYIDAVGHWTRLGTTVQLVQEDVSFGDLNNDGVDDAAVVVNRPSSNGAANYFLAAMLNQGGIMFNIADISLGTSLNIATHSITAGVVVLNGDRYVLLGNAITRQ